MKFALLTLTALLFGAPATSFALQLKCESDQPSSRMPLYLKDFRDDKSHGGIETYHSIYNALLSSATPHNGPGVDKNLETTFKDEVVVMTAHGDGYSEVQIAMTWRDLREGGPAFYRFVITDSPTGTGETGICHCSPIP